jgi:excisionase family DNA binding protein
MTQETPVAPEFIQVHLTDEQVQQLARAHEAIVYTVPQAAKLLKVSERTISTMLRLGRLVRRKIGGRTVIPRTSVEAFLKRDHPGRAALPQTAEEAKRPHRGSATRTRRGSR